MIREPASFDRQGPQNERTAIVVLGLAIASFFVPLIPAVAALILAPKALHRIEESEGRLTGEKLVKAGRILAWVSIGLFALTAISFSGLILTPGEY